MLNGLFANASVENILLFLFVNEKAYASQMSSCLGLALTPIQNGLSRLEKSDVVKCYCEKNKKIYFLNSDYALHKELESLLKRAYFLLPTQSKKQFCFVNFPERSIHEDQKKETKTREQLIQFWKRLSLVESLDFTARYKQDVDFWTKLGHAEVRKTFPSENQVLFYEEGKWLSDEQPTTTFSNRFLWTLDLDKLLISLEHLRYGPQNPVFLFHLKLSKSKTLVSLDAHLCKDDSYLGALTWKKQWIDLNLRVIGPKKNHFLNYLYK